MSMQQAQIYLETTYCPGRKKGLQAVEQAVMRLGVNQDEMKVIHVAGTNGKGSFCAMMSSVLAVAGYKVGTFTSPHLERLNERFVINGVQISDGDFLRILQDVVALSNEIYGQDDGFTFFEIFVLIAFKYFYEQKVDFFVLEVGIGGLVDVTNIVKRPILCAIMSIGMDHMEILGNTLEEIAHAKGGIIKPNCPVALYDDQPLVHNILTGIAKNNNATVYNASSVNINEFEIGLLGKHQQLNAAVVVAACAALKNTGVAINTNHIKDGLKNAKHPGRMEIIDKEPLTILEGAHNLQGAQACVGYMQEAFADRQVTLVLGILKDKEYAEIVNALASIANCIIFTKPEYDFKANQPEELAATLITNHKNVYTIHSYIDAIKKAKEITPANGVILCTGSLYLIGDIRRFFTGGSKNA